MNTIRRSRITLVFAALVALSCGGNPEVNNSNTGGAGALGGSGGLSGSGGSGGGIVVDSGSDASGGADGCSDCDAAPVCGDGVIEAPELCDDGNAMPGDGCSGVCAIEPGYSCLTPGQPCVPVAAVCGDGLISGSEACDDGNATPGDGCSATCNVEQGYACSAPGKPCTPVTTAQSSHSQLLSVE